MQPSEILARFQAAAAANKLDGNTAPGMGDLLASLGRSELDFTDGQTGLDSDIAWLTGTATFLTKSWPFRLTGKDAGDAAHPEWSQFGLRLIPPGAGANWTFADGFADLPQSFAQPENERGLQLMPSLIAPLVVAQPVLVAANTPSGGAPKPRFQGQLVLTGSPLAVYAPYVGAGPLPLDGELNFDSAHPDAAPKMNLFASGSGTISAGSLQLGPIGIQLRTDWTDPPAVANPPPTLSVILLYGATSVGSPPLNVTLSALLLSGDYLWVFAADFNPGLGLGDGLRLIASLFPGAPQSGFELPAGLGAINAFKLSRIEFGVQPPVGTGGLTLVHTAIEITADIDWDLPLAFVRLDKVGLRWFYFWGGDQPLPLGSVWGQLTLGAKKGQSVGATPALTAPSTTDTGVTVTTRVTVPDMGVYASLDGPVPLTMSQFFGCYFDGPTPPIGNSGSPLTIDNFEIVGSLNDHHYLAAIQISGIWSITAGSVTFSLDQMQFQVETTVSQLRGELLAVASVTVPGQSGTPRPTRMLALARYPGTGAWEFEARLLDPLNVNDLAAAFIGTPAPAWVPVVEVTAFSASYSTAQGNPYRVSGLLTVTVPETLLGTTLQIQFGAVVERKVDGEGNPRPVAGALTLTLTINRFEVAGAISFGDSQKTYMFSIAWRDVKLIAQTKLVGSDNHQALSVRMEGVTLGSIVEYLVNLANPNANYRLEPPWDFLNAVDLARFELIIDQKLQTISLKYNVDIDIVFAQLTSVGLIYDRSTGEGSVRFLVEGSMLGQDYRGADALQWDAVKDNPPSVPGKGEQLFDLRYLGVGQHVTPAALGGKFDSISQVIDTLVRDMVEVDGPSDLPVGQDKAIHFDAASQWLLGLDCTVMDTVRLQLVLHDPDLYGVLISLQGAQAQSLAGFSFELYYRKVTADIGVFHARLQVPDAFRQLQFGAVSVTLGVITVDIFTNGNFRIDLGFPKNRDFTDSFAVEVTIFNGHGGIYFGLLDGATSDRVPRITNGTFSPVLELGVGLMVGAGRTFNKGPLSAGLYVDLVVIFEGVLAWFHPSDTGAPTALYYWAQGTAGIVGKLYGKVDFKIISVSVSLEASAFATVTLAAHQPTDISLDVDVQVEASVKFLFFTVNFHFGLHLSTTFTIGSQSATPWQLAPGQTTRGQAQLTATAHAPPRRRGAALAEAQRATYLEARAGGTSYAALVSVVETSTADGTTQWHLVFDKNAQIFPGGGTRPVTLKVTPAFTIADLPIQWNGQAAPAADDAPDYRIAFLLSAETPVPPDAQTIADTAVQTTDTSAHADTPGDMPFTKLAEAVFRWTMDAAGIKVAVSPNPPPNVTLGLLLDVTDQLALPEASSLGFTADNLDGFLLNNLAVTLSGTPDGDTPNGVSAAPFPVIPALHWSWSDPTQPDQPVETRDFWVYRQVGAQYESDIVQYFARLDPRPESDQPDPAAPLAAADAETTESLASFVFRDYFLMIARAAVQAASDYLSAYPHMVDANDTLQSIAGQFPVTVVTWTGAAGDTVDSIAAAYGLSADEFLALNPDFVPPPPGQTAAVNLGMTVQAVADSAAAWPVARGLTVTLGDLTAQVEAGQTLDQIATQWLLADATGWITAPELRAQTELLRAGAPVPLPAYSYANPQALSLTLAAAVLFVRLAGGSVPTQDAPFAEWYVEAIVGLGPYDVDGNLKPSFAVPAALYDTANTLTWTTLPGDTLLEIATALSLAQNIEAGSRFATWLQAVQAANPQWTQAVALPASAVALVAPRDTLDSLAERLFLDASTAAFATLVRGIDLLVPLAGIPVLAARMATQATSDQGPDWTLLATAQSVGLALEDFAVRAQTQAGLLKVQTDALVIRDVPVLDLETLVTKLQEPLPAATISGQVSRFMLNGLRLPTPELVDGVWQATGPMDGLYDLTGQQLAGPAPVSAEGGTVRLNLVMTKGQPADWLTFADAATTGVASGVMTIDHGAPIVPLNPALAASADPATGALPTGMVVLTSTADSITIAINEQDLVDNYPATVLSPAWIQPGLQPLALSREVAVQRPISQPIRWRTSVAPPLPVTPPAGAQPSLWLLSGDLMSTASGGISPNPFDLMQLSAQAAPGDPPQPLAAWAWGTLIDISVQRVPGAPGTLELFGADTSDRQRLAQLLMYLGVLPLNGATIPVNAADTVTVALGWTLPPGPGTPSGLTTAALDPDASFLIKTNLSTETHSGNTVQPRMLRAAGPSSGEYFASFAAADLKRLLTLVWECSVVGGGGYWLSLIDPKGEQLVPDAAFDQDGRALITLVIALGTQSQATTPNRSLYAFNNAAVIGDGVDPGSVALYAVAANGVETQRQATVRPGENGFTLDLTKPASPDNDTPELRAERVFSLLGYQLLGQSPWLPSNEGQPLAPQVKRDAEGNLVSDVWNLMRVIPINRFYVSSLADVAGLPPVADDPYAGVNPPVPPQQGEDPAQQDVTVSLWFHDLLGNTTAPGGKGSLDVPITYTDPLIAPGAWPATVLSYQVSGDGTAHASLDATVSLQGAALQPGGLETGAAAATRAGQQNERFARIWYQVSQPYVEAKITTTLKRDGQGNAIPLDASIATLRGFAGGAYVLSATLAGLGSAVALASEVGSALTPASVTAAYGVDYDALGAANGPLATNAIFTAGTLDVPQFVLADPNVSVAAQCPQGVDPQTVLNAAQNSVLPLQPGIALTTPIRTGSVPIPSNPQDPTVPLTSLLATLKCTLTDFATQNAAVANLLQPGAVFTYNGFTVQIGTDPDTSGASLNGVMNAFITDGVAVTVPEILQANGDVPGLFRAGAPLVATTYVAARGDTIAANDSGSDQATLAGLNTQTVGLFPAGSPIFLQTVSQTAPAATLADFAQQQGVTTGDLFTFNPNAALPDALVLLPGRFAWPADATGLRIPLSVPHDGDLTTLAATLLFGQGVTPPLALAQLNATLPGTVNGGLDLVIGGVPVTTQAGDSFAAVYTRAGKTIDDFVAAVKDDPKVLVEGAVLIAPPAVLPGAVPLAPDAAAQPFGITAIALLAANAGTPGILVPGVSLLAAPGATEAETIAPHDTLVSLLHRFSHRGVTSSIDQLLRANPDSAFLKGGASLLLPPADAVLLGDLGAPADETWPEPIFAVHAWLGLVRPETLCDATLAQDPKSGVLSAKSALPPIRPNDAPGNADPGSASLVPFATALEKALPALRVATGKVLSEDEEGEGTEIWVAVFGSQGIASVTVTPPLTLPGTTGPQPRTYALRPLSNTLIGREGVTLQNLDTSTGGLTGSETRAFQAVDLEVWAQTFLADMEQMLAYDIASGAYNVNSTALESIAGTKKRLARAVAKGLAPVVEIPTDNIGLNDAIDTLEQALLASLTDGYAASALIQFDSDVTSVWSTDSARLSGSATIVTPGTTTTTLTPTISDAKIPLVTDDKGRVTFILSVPDVAKQETIDLQLDYAIVELEFNVQAEIEGYDRSDWIAFVNPIGSGMPQQLSIQLGTPTTPLPLRAYPPVAVLLDQAAQPPADPASVADAVKWSYAFAFRHQSAEQDRILLTVDLNVANSLSVMAVSSDDLFGALAQYVYVADPLRTMLAALKDWKSIPDPSVIATALTTFATLASDVADAWDAHWPDPPSDDEPIAMSEELAPAVAVTSVPAVTFDLVMTLGGEDGLYKRLTLERDTTAQGYGWPAISCTLADGTVIALCPPGTCGDNTPCDCDPDAGPDDYLFPRGAAVPVNSLLSWQFVYPGLHVAHYQNATASIAVDRNAQLLPAPAITDPAFVYQTPRASYGAPVTPFISVTKPLDIGTWSSDPASGPLPALFNTIFDNDPSNRTIAIGVRYGYQLAAGLTDDTGIETYLPVVQSPAVPYDSSTQANLVAAITDWQDREQPVTDRGRWVLWLDLHSSIDPEVLRPVLQLKRLESPMSGS